MPTKNIPLSELEMRGNFVQRHIGSNKQQIQEMLDELGLDSLEDIIAAAFPDNIVDHEPLELVDAISERAAIIYLRKIRARNKTFTSLIGMGYYDTVMPAVIKRNVLENPSWYTAYTPYQAEVSQGQGRLEALLNFQQVIIDLTAMDIANASLLDEATAAAEAMNMSRRISKSSSNNYFVDKLCHPQTIAVLETHATPLGLNQARHATSRNSGTPVAIIRSPTQRMGDALNALRPQRLRTKAASSLLPHWLDGYSECNSCSSRVLLAHVESANCPVAYQGLKITTSLSSVSMIFSDSTEVSQLLSS